jgi:hypothetical protein
VSARTASRRDHFSSQSRQHQDEASFPGKLCPGWLAVEAPEVQANFLNVQKRKTFGGAPPFPFSYVQEVSSRREPNCG